MGRTCAGLAVPESQPLQTPAFSTSARSLAAACCRTGALHPNLPVVAASSQTHTSPPRNTPPRVRLLLRRCSRLPDVAQTRQAHIACSSSTDSRRLLAAADVDRAYPLPCSAPSPLGRSIRFACLSTHSTLPACDCVGSQPCVCAVYARQLCLHHTTHRARYLAASSLRSAYSYEEKQLLCRCERELSWPR